MPGRKTDNTWKKEFAARVRYRMEYLGIKQCDLVKASGLPQSTINRCVRGEFVPRADTAAKLAVALAMTTDELINFKI